MLEETWSMGCRTRRILAVGAAAADPHCCWWRRRCCCCSCCCVPARLGVERNTARLGVEEKKLALPNYCTAADYEKPNLTNFSANTLLIVLVPSYNYKHKYDDE